VRIAYIEVEFNHIGSPYLSVPVQGDVMKKVILAVMLTALALFLILPNLSWGI
jgi:hypothetical protein